MEKYAKEHETPPGNFCPVLPNVHGTDFYLGGLKYHFAIKTLYMVLPDFWGMAARLESTFQLLQLLD